MSHQTSRHPSSIRPGDFVSYLDERGVPWWGTAVTGVLNERPWPRVRIDFHYDDGHRSHTVPARDVTRAHRVMERRCFACGPKKRVAV